MASLSNARKSRAEVCKRCAGYISLYADGAQGVPKELIEHINECPACAKAFETATSIAGDLGRLPEIIPDESFHADVMDGVNRFRDEKPRRSLMPRLAMAAASAAFSIIVFSAVAGGLSSLAPSPPRQSVSGGAGDYQEELYTVEDGAVAETAATPPQYKSARAYTASNSETQNDEPSVLYFEGGGSPTESQPDGGTAQALPAGLARSESVTTGYDQEYETAGEAQSALADESLVADDPSMSFIIAADAEPDTEPEVMAVSRYMVIEADDAEDVLRKITGMGVDVVSSYVTANGVQVQAGITVSAPAAQLGFYTNEMAGVGVLSAVRQSARSLTLEIADAENSLAVKRGEYERLMAYSGRAADLESVIRLSDSLSAVINDADYLQNRLNGLYQAAENSVINIEVISTDASGKPDSSGEPFAERVSGRFADSLNFVADSAETVVIWVAGAAVWVALGAAIAVPVALLFNFVRKSAKRR